MTDYERIEKVIRYLELHALEQPGLAQLARVAGLSEFHFQRLFRRWVGTTPKSFLQFLTARHARAQLARSRDLLSVSLDAGLSGPGRLHDLMVSVDGLSPGELKRGAAGLTLRYGIHPTPFGPALIALSPRGICHLEFIDEAKRSLRGLRARFPDAELIEDPEKTRSLLARIFRRGKRSGFRLNLKGTPFQLKVWEALLSIPEGRVLSYRDIARAIGMPRAARAVGSAIGLNPIAYLIPCHRVIRETGVLGDYRWGADRKRALLWWETLRRSAADVGDPRPKR